MITVYPDNGTDSSGLLAPPKSRLGATFSSNGQSTASYTDIGAVTANMYKTALFITGKGILESLNFGSNDTKTIQGQLIIDGNVVIDTGAVSFTTVGTCNVFPNNNFPIPFNKSLVLQLKPSVSQSSGTLYYATYRIS
jgi:hypothetical protein